MSQALDADDGADREPIAGTCPLCWNDVDDVREHVTDGCDPEASALREDYPTGTELERITVRTPTAALALVDQAVEDTSLQNRSEAIRVAVNRLVADVYAGNLMPVKIRERRTDDTKL